MIAKALFFDVFGTLVDWRTSIAREVEAILRPRGFTFDALAFADAWRGEYQPAMDEVRSGRIPFCKLDVLHRRNLDRILPRFGISGLDEDVLRELNLAWHRLDAWPDVASGLTRLKRRFLLAPVSNGNISLMVDLARRNGLPWDAILGSEVARDFKPKPGVYLAACAALDLPPADCMMVAAAQQRSVACGGVRSAHGARGASERARSRPRRAGAESAGGCSGRQSGRIGGEARGLERDRHQYGRTVPLTVVRSIRRRSVDGKSVRACEEQRLSHSRRSPKRHSCS
jgi:2-haloacid dehalogenase